MVLVQISMLQMLLNMFFTVCGIIIHPHLNRSSRVLHSAMPAAPKEELHGLPLDEVGQNRVEAVVHLKGEGVVHGGVDQALV